MYAGNALRGYGNLIIIKHNDDYLSAYAHNDTMLVREQQEVKAGQKIATMGSTGTSSVRLHFEIRYKGKIRKPAALSSAAIDWAECVVFCSRYHG
ncbi:Murein hydrolase activator NlpD precursor [Serratia fonticola]|uniref:Murein hydrolase activator NlpD n=1 Tax=Serratia fonticola TaxID=47917 RepID=A0A4U9WI50_SERFO|nr:Murein hydrolase activator NlpD precursor [Serratia fonticola]